MPRPPANVARSAVRTALERSAGESVSQAQWVRKLCRLSRVGEESEISSRCSSHKRAWVTPDFLRSSGPQIISTGSLSFPTTSPKILTTSTAGHSHSGHRLQRRWFSGAPGGSSGSEAGVPGAASSTASSRASSSVPGTRERDAYHIIYTCGKCGLREGKKISKNSYHNGIVIVQCSGCKSRHLIADNFCWFGDAKKNVEDLMRDKGESIVKTLRDPETGAWKLRVQKGNGEVVETDLTAQADTSSEPIEGGEGGTTSSKEDSSLATSSGNVMAVLEQADLLHMEGMPEATDASSEAEGTTRK